MRTDNRTDISNIATVEVVILTFMSVFRSQHDIQEQKENRPSGQCVVWIAVELIMQRIARTQSPSPRNYAPESPTFEAIAGVSPPECNGQASPWEYPLVDQGVSCAR